MLLAMPAHAREAECLAMTAEVTGLREPQFGGLNVWDMVYEQDGMDVFADMVPLDNNLMVAAGVYTKDKDDTVYHPLLVKFDERLKKVWEVREDGKTLKTIHRLIKTKEGFTVLGDIADSSRGNGFYIGSYDENGKVRGEAAPVFEKGGDLDAKAFVPASDGTGYIIAAQYIDSKNTERQYGILYKISKAGKILWKRSYRPGQSTVFNTVKTALDGSYIVTGQILLNDQASGGWLLRVDESGAIKWQRTYPRGQAATFLSVAQTKGGDFILTGKARSTDPSIKNLAAWVMKTDSAGNPLWQRYFKGPYMYEASDVIVYEDGRASVLINGQGLDADHRSHVRIATLSPQGSMQSLEDFTEGQNASAGRLVPGLNGERIIAGYAQTSFGDKQEGNEAADAPEYTYDGWLLAARALDTFDDPCASGPVESPILP